MKELLSLSPPLSVCTAHVRCSEKRAHVQSKHGETFPSGAERKYFAGAAAEGATLDVLDAFLKSDQSSWSRDQSFLHFCWGRKRDTKLSRRQGLHLSALSQDFGTSEAGSSVHHLDIKGSSLDLDQSVSFWVFFFFWENIFTHTERFRTLGGSGQLLQAGVMPGQLE